jgi:hypothetical protein
LVSGGSQFVAPVAQLVLDAAEGLVVGQVDQPFGHPVGDGIGGRAEPLAEGLETLFTPFRGLGSSGNRGV